MRSVNTNPKGNRPKDSCQEISIVTNHWTPTTVKYAGTIPLAKGFNDCCETVWQAQIKLILELVVLLLRSESESCWPWIYSSTFFFTSFIIGDQMDVTGLKLWNLEVNKWALISLATHYGWYLAWVYTKVFPGPIKDDHCHWIQIVKSERHLLNLLVLCHFVS